MTFDFKPYFQSGRFTPAQAETLIRLLRAFGDSIQSDEIAESSGLDTYIANVTADDGAVATGVGVHHFRVPFDCTLLLVKASLTAPSSSGDVEVDVKLDGVSIFDTDKITIPEGETTSLLGVLPSLVLDDLLDDQEFSIDVLDDGTGAEGLKVTFIWLPTSPDAVIEIFPETLPDAEESSPYSQQLTATGGFGSKAFDIIAGALPNGLTLSPSGLLAGTPTEDGTFGITVEAKDALGNKGTRAYSLFVDEAPTPAWATWNPSHKTPAASLTNGDKRLNSVGGDTHASTRSTGIISGNRYFAIRVSTDASGGVAAGGVSDESKSFDGPQGSDGWTGSGASIGYWGPTWGVRHNGGLVHSQAYSHNPQIIEIAVRAGTRRVWIRRNGAAWIGGGDPAADTTPTVTLSGTGAIYASATVVVSGAGSGRWAELLSDPAEITGTPPSGFTAGLPG